MKPLLMQHRLEISPKSWLSQNSLPPPLLLSTSQNILKVDDKQHEERSVINNHLTILKVEAEQPPFAASRPSPKFPTQGGPRHFHNNTDKPPHHRDSCNNTQIRFKMKEILTWQPPPSSSPVGQASSSSLLAPPRFCTLDCGL